MYIFNIQQFHSQLWLFVRSLSKETICDAGSLNCQETNVAKSVSYPTMPPDGRCHIPSTPFEILKIWFLEAGVITPTPQIENLIFVGKLMSPRNFISFQ